MIFERIADDNSSYLNDIVNLYMDLLVSQASDGGETLTVEADAIKHNIQMQVKLKNYFLIIARKDDQVIGFAEAFFLMESLNFIAGNHIYVGNFNLSDEYRKHFAVSIIPKFRRMLEDWGKEMGAKYMIADIFDHNKSMLTIAKLYKYRAYTHRVVKEIT